MSCLDPDGSSIGGLVEEPIYLKVIHASGGFYFVLASHILGMQMFRKKKIA